MREILSWVEGCFWVLFVALVVTAGIDVYVRWWRPGREDDGEDPGEGGS